METYKKIYECSDYSQCPIYKFTGIMYRMIGFNIGKNVFIGMKCYMDDVAIDKTVIEDNVTISYGCYFACHGKDQGHTMIHIKQGAYLGMRCNILSGKDGITIGEKSIIGAGSLVNTNIPAHMKAAGVPAKVLDEDHA